MRSTHSVLKDSVILDISWSNVTDDFLDTIQVYIYSSLAVLQHQSGVSIGKYGLLLESNQYLLVSSHESTS